MASNSTLKKQRSWHLVPSLRGKSMGEKWNSDRFFIFLGSQKVTMDDDRSHEIKRGLPLGRKAMTNLDTHTVLKSKGITLPTKVHTVKDTVFSVVTYGFESWTIKKSEHQKIDAFESWCWRRLLESPGLQGDQTS